MKPWVRWVVLGAAAVGVAVLFVALQPENDDERSPTPSTTTPTDEPSPTGSASPTPTASPTPEVHQIVVTVSGDQIQGPTRPTVTLGETVLLVVRADVSDEVHVHTYDLMADVAPGEPARIRFKADVPGVVEVELEDAGRLLLELEIGP
jgi:hypothetical protein